MRERWYNSDLAGALGFATILLVAGLSIRGCTRTTPEDVELERVRSGNTTYTLIEKDLNGNGLPERFYEIDGEKYFLEVDGKSVEDLLK